MLILKSLRFLNFKGIRDETIEFDEMETNIYGPNGTYKTTIFDGFNFVMFGKDSHYKSSFSLKTLTPGGAVIMRLPHSVEAVFDHDGRELRLKKEYEERWEKPTGKTEEEFRGHRVKCYWNGVGLTSSEYEKKMNTVIDEQVALLLTDPLYFNDDRRYDWQKRREILFVLAEFNENELAAKDERYAKLLEIFRTKTEKGYRDELSQRRKKLQMQLTPIQPRIDEKRRDLTIFKDQDWDAIAKDIEQKRAQLDGINKVLASNKQAMDQLNKEQEAKRAVIRTLKNNLTEIKGTVHRKMVTADQSRLSGHSLDIEKKKNIQSNIDFLKEKIKSMSRDIALNTDELTKLRDIYKQEFEKKYELPKDEKSCPTCQREFPEDEVAEKLAVAEKNFNLNKIKVLKEINQKGANITALISKLDALKKADESKLDEQQKDVADLQAKIDKFNAEEAKRTPVEQLIESAVKDNPEYIKTLETIAQREKELAAMVELPPDPELTAKQSALQRELINLQTELNKKQQIEDINNRIAELEGEMKTVAQAIADIQKVEMVITEMSKEKVKMLEEKINSMFRLVKWKMFDKQVDGELSPCCSCTVDGVPYADVNDGHKRLAGIDITNVLRDHYKIYPPVFIDGAESITEPITCNSQLIRLSTVVTDDGLRHISRKGETIEGIAAMR